MEEKKFDPYQFIGFILIALILTWMLYRNGPQEKVQTQTDKQTIDAPLNQAIQDSIQSQQKIKAYGDLGSFFIPNDQSNIQLTTNSMIVEIQSKGAEINALLLSEFENYDGLPIPMIKNENSRFNVALYTKDGRILNTRDFYFKTNISEKDDEFVVSLKSTISEDMYVIYEYIFPKSGYLFSVNFKSVGMGALLDNNQPPKINWSTNVFRNSRSIDYENRYTELTFGYEDDRVDYLSLSGNDEENRENIRWISYRQHFFSAILIPESSIKTVNLKSKDLSSDQILEEKFTKYFESSYLLPKQGENINTTFKFYYGPTDYNTLQNLEGDLEASIPIGWGIFGWINKFIFLPLFGFLSSFLSYGIAIIVMTIIVRLLMSPVTYKSYVSQIKMKVLRPDIEAISAKFKDDAVKRQQETMSLYTRAGANPMSGCIPALIQLPVFYALFSFFPVAFVLRDKSFLWADDLSSFDSILDLGFNIPFYGDHVSLFPILASVAIFFYTKMTTGQQPMPQQPGMPNMKIIMYLMPLMMLFFFNNYASGLSLYYFVSNLLTIILMLVIKNYIIDDTKIHAQIEENKSKPKKSSGFSARLQKAIEEAEKQKKARKK
ncbi:MAG: membrane protein insertase YidC [Flavobacteriaceae bacterium TMED68]|nr:MAG: membrane protein insertase YidC [Flavobacteriaceae bacterium TMED68]|tara:strand:- start:54300 stop:56111 length:1812 start_codon:yes stop_codon:yes gene_type:complete